MATQRCLQTIPDYAERYIAPTTVGTFFDIERDPVMRLTEDGYQAIKDEHCGVAWMVQIQKLAILNCASCAVATFSLQDHKEVCVCIQNGRDGVNRQNI